VKLLQPHQILSSCWLRPPEKTTETSLLHRILRFWNLSSKLGIVTSSTHDLNQLRSVVGSIDQKLRLELSSNSDANDRKSIIEKCLGDLQAVINAIKVCQRQHNEAHLMFIA
jgi:hypothetical protein